jgi:hypothetical protein
MLSGVRLSSGELQLTLPGRGWTHCTRRSGGFRGPYSGLSLVQPCQRRRCGAATRWSRIPAVKVHGAELISIAFRSLNNHLPSSAFTITSR